MALTLFEAQKFSWKIFRKINEKLDVARGKSWDSFVIVTDILEEAGEVAGVVKGLEGFKPPNKQKTKEMLARELADLLYGIFVLAERYGIELEEVFLETVNDYVFRFMIKLKNVLLEWRNGLRDQSLDKGKNWELSLIKRFGGVGRS